MLLLFKKLEGLVIFLTLSIVFWICYEVAHSIRLIMEIEITKEADAIEKYFCEKFKKLQRHSMTNELSSIMIQMLLSKNSENIQIAEKEKPFLMKVIEARIKHSFTYTVLDTRLILFLTVLSKTPGVAIMYLTYLQYWAKKHQEKLITFDNFCQEIFPMGFPSEEDLHQLWLSVKVNNEKGGSDNLLDYQSALKSIQFEEVKL